jgi:hypothetical protein
MKHLKYGFLVALALMCGGCDPCDCKEATLVNPAGITLKITFDDSILPWVKDKFTVTIIKQGEVSTIQGTFDKSGDTIRFDADGALPFLSVKSGDVNALDCDKPMKGQFTVTPLVAPGVPGVPLTFQCTKEK